MRLRLTNCTIIDSVSPNPLPNAYLDVEAGRICALGLAATAPDVPLGDTLDLGGAYLTPGLIECHNHLFLDDPRRPHPNSVAAHTLDCLEHALTAFHAGFTGLRCLGDSYFVDVALRDMFATGKLLGPRIWASGYLLTPTAGHCAELEEQMWFVKVTDGVDGFRKTAREQLQNGVDHVKLSVTGGLFGPPQAAIWSTKMTEAEIAAAAQTALTRGKRVAVHATTADGVKKAVRNGATSIEHGYSLDDEAIELMLKYGTYFIPTLACTHLIPDFLTDDYEWAAFNEQTSPVPASRLAQYREYATTHREWVRKAFVAGVKIAVGADTVPFPKPSHVEIAFMVRYGGLTPWQALVAATKTGAECCGAGDELGTIEVGKYADLLGFAQNPLEDITRLREPLIIMKEGVIAIDRRAQSEKWAAGGAAAVTPLLSTKHKNMGGSNA